MYITYTAYWNKTAYKNLLDIQISVVGKAEKKPDSLEDGDLMMYLLWKNIYSMLQGLNVEQIATITLI